MRAKWLFGIAIGVAVLASIYFVLRLNLNMAVLSMVGLFTLTNAMRAKTFHDQGMERESKWMRWVSMFFGAAFIVLLVIISMM